MSQNDNNGFKRMKPVVAAIIQARMGSTRLPGKSLLDLAGYPMLYHVIERTMAIEGVDNVVVATSIEPENKQLVELSDKMGVHSFVGSPENVLERYFFASIEFDCDYIIRVTGDNPFI
ncbi:MAG: hypothetical protein GY754_06715, partial [bacterium]|nr:hypothetical protein [bacterium]